MKLTSPQIQTLAQKVLAQWKKSNLAHLKVDEKVILEKIESIVRAELQREVELEREVHAMLDKLERSHGGQFERHRMYPLLKSKLAKEKKVIL